MFAYAPIYLSNDPGFNPPTAAATLPISAPVLSSPFTGVNIEYQLTQKFQCHRAAYKPLAINSKWGTWPTATVADVSAYQGFILCAESPREDVGGNVVQWTRTYAKVPATYSLASSISYTFVGFENLFYGVDVASGVSRDPFTRTVGARVQYDYFLLDPINGPLKTVVDIQKTYPIDIQRYFRSPGSTSYRVYVTSITSVHQDGVPTVPTIEDYLGWINAGIEIIANVGPFRNWLGNIVERQVTYILPQ